MPPPPLHLSCSAHVLRLRCVCAAPAAAPCVCTFARRTEIGRCHRCAKPNLVFPAGSQSFYLFKILRAHILPLTNCAFNKSGDRCVLPRDPGPAHQPGCFV